MGYLPSWLQSKPTDNHVVREQLPSTTPSTNAAAPTAAADDDALQAAVASSNSAWVHDEDERSGSGALRYGPSLAIPMTGASLAFIAGSVTASKRTALVFMAENAHRRPNTVQGWYFYNKTKNYKVMLGAAKGGFKAATRVGLLTMAYVAIEESAERARNAYIGQQSNDGNIRFASWNGRWIDGGVAGVGVATIASITYRLPGPMSRRVLGLGFLAGSAVGGLREVRSALVEAQQKQQQHASHA